MAREGRALAVIPQRRKFGNEKLENVAAAIEGGYKLFNYVRNTYRQKFSFAISVSEKDDLYQEVNDWLLKVLPHEKHKAVSVSTGTRSARNSGMESPASDAKSETIDPLTISYDSKTSRQVIIEGHKVDISLHTPEPSDNKKYYDMFDVARVITFTVFSHPAQQAVIRQLEKLNQQRKVSRKAVLKMTTQWGDWRTRSDLPPRTMESVNMPAEQKDRIVADLGGFLEAEDRYNRLAIPWHRGYMFHGPPGTGKTSLVKALANHFNLDLWYISLSDLSAESSLLNLIGSVGPRSMLLLEDIDTIKIAHDRDSSESGKISTGSLLNVLDGVATPHGLITVMTTNRFDILDSALKRAGRMDFVEELGYPSKSTVREMFEYFFNEKNSLVGIGENEFVVKGVSTSQIAEIFKRHMDDPKKAMAELKDLVKKTGSVA